MGSDQHHTDMGGLITTRKGTFDVGEYLDETLRKANEFAKCAIVLIDSLKTLQEFFVLDASGYLASHSAELYLKALIVGNAGQDGYDKFIRLRSKHDLIELLNILVEYDENADSLRQCVKPLNKYSGDKVRFAEDIITDHPIMDFGNTEIRGVEIIQSYANIFFNY